MTETKLQRETRLTGSAELVSAIDATLQAMMGQKPNSVLARKVVGRWCQSANAQEFKEKIKDYLGRLDEQVLLGFYMTIQSRVEMMEAGPRHCGRSAVTLVMDDLDFTENYCLLKRGERCILEGKVTRAFGSSMEVVVKISVAEVHSGTLRMVGNAYFMYVILKTEAEKAGRVKVEVPELVPSTAEEVLEFAQVAELVEEVPPSETLSPTARQGGALTFTELVLPFHANHMGNTFGGQIMHWMVKGAKTAVWLHLRLSCAPRELPDDQLGVGGRPRLRTEQLQHAWLKPESVDTVHFKAPSHVGDRVVVTAAWPTRKPLAWATVNFACRSFSPERMLSGGICFADPMARPSSLPGAGAVHCGSADLLGQLCANDLLRDIDRWQRAPWAELATEATEQGLEVTEQVERQELEVRLKKLRVWRLLPLQPLQDLCRLEAAHVSIRKRCEEKGIPEGKLEDRQRAELILNEFDRLEQMSTGDLGRLYKSRGFAYADDMEPESLREQLKEHLLYQELSLSHLRQLWHALEIPVMKLPSVLVAQGLLDQLKRLEKKDERQLRAELRRRQLPLEQSASKSKLLSRLRCLAWS
eukprot:g23278.t1